MGKAAISSTGIIGAVIAMLATLAPLAGWSISETDQAALRTVLESGVLVVSNLIAFGGAVMALYGRFRATKQITGIIKPTPAQDLTAQELNQAELVRIREGSLR